MVYREESQPAEPVASSMFDCRVQEDGRKRFPEGKRWGRNSGATIRPPLGELTCEHDHDEDAKCEQAGEKQDDSHC